MARIEHLADFIRRWEGGFSDDPLDAGGATLCGVTLQTFTAFRLENRLPAPSADDLKNISPEEWNAILKSRYWDPLRADRILPQPVAHILVDWAWGSGTLTPVRKLQQLLNLKVDGALGDKTLDAVNAHPYPLLLFNRLWTLRKDFYVGIVRERPDQIRFLAGWLNRLYDTVDCCFQLAVREYA